MAGDWIKMRADLFTHPKVVRMSSALKADRLRTVGGLMAVWCLFDAHSVDGILDGYTCDALDDLIGWPGFCPAMAKVGWLVENGESLTTPRFDEHNGQSAKRRAQETERKRMARGSAPLSAPQADETRTREEKRREDRKPPKSPKGEPEGFAEWYAAYPRKEARPAAAKAFAKVTAPLPVLLAALGWQKRQTAWTKEGGQYVPLPATYLNNERWNDQRGDASPTVPMSPAALYKPEPSLTPEQLAANRERMAREFAKLNLKGAH